MRYDIIDIAAKYVVSRGLALQRRITFVKHAKMLADASSPSPRVAFRPKPVNATLAAYAIDHAPATVKDLRGDLLTLWRHAAVQGLCEPPAAWEVWKPKVPATLPECYSIEEVRELLLGCGHMRGRYGKLARAAYWDALIRVAWDTGLRKGDLLRLSAGDLRGHVLVTVAHKTGARVIHTLAPETVAALLAVGRLAFTPRPWYFTPHFHELRDLTVGHGQFKWLRRSSGSYVALEHGDAAGAAHLGHTSVATFRRYYDARLIGDSRPAPPAL